jgi:hypothetical protein
LDNNVVVFYDKEYDDTPYALLDNYKDQRGKYGSGVQRVLEKYWLITAAPRISPFS